jgi:hypothetical protein
LSAPASIRIQLAISGILLPTSKMGASGLNGFLLSLKSALENKDFLPQQKNNSFV